MGKKISITEMGNIWGTIYEGQDIFEDILLRAEGKPMLDAFREWCALRDLASEGVSRLDDLDLAKLRKAKGKFNSKLYKLIGNGLIIGTGGKNVKRTDDPG